VEDEVVRDGKHRLYRILDLCSAAASSFSGRQISSQQVLSFKAAMTQKAKAEAAAQNVPVYQMRADVPVTPSCIVRPSTFLTLETCHLPPRAVRMPRLLRASAIPR
jgi:hypothetical protein